VCVCVCGFVRLMQTAFQFKLRINVKLCAKPVSIRRQMQLFEFDYAI